MGKRTDAQLKLLAAKGDACTATAASLNKCLSAWPTLDKAWNTFEAEMRALPDWTTHPYAKKRIAFVDSGISLTAKLKSDVNQLNLALSDFKALVTKKEKSKNPFKSKNSVPSSKATIKDYDSVIESMYGVIKLGGTAFR